MPSRAPRRPARAVLLAALGLASVGAEAPRKTAAPPAIPVARVSYVDDVVEMAEPGKAFTRIREGTRLKTGDRLRTGLNGTARIEYSWMAATVGANSLVSIPTSVVLATVLEEGRIEQSSQGGEIIKLLTAESEVRGAGWVVVRHEGRDTFVSAWKGSFRVEAGGRTVTVQRGQGTIVHAGAGPQAPIPLPPQPNHLVPGADPVYRRLEEPVTLRWRSPARSLQLQVLGVDSDDILMNRSVSEPPVKLAIPWVGTYRWRLAARAENGLEGLPSQEGLITVVAR
jgi:hypothetical protein